ncbi:MAG: glycosyltransferase [Chitinophagales bacterium]|nr:glycosyltransferase [Chitinophagales bacterium]
MKQHSLSLITPVFNEEEIIKSTIEKNFKVLDKYIHEYEIIIIDDGSIDNSAKIIENMSVNYPILFIKHGVNKGFGAAMKTGISHSKMDYILCIPADSPLDDDTFKSFSPHFGWADILVGYRRERLGYSWWMKLNSKIYHTLINKLFHLNLKDYNWIHAYRRDVFIIGNIEIVYSGIFMLAEMIIKSKEKGFKIIEFPVNQQMRITGHASSANLRVILKTLYDTLHFYFTR